MTISALWPLWLLPFIFVIIIFYLLKQPAKEKIVSSLSYWQSLYKQQHAKKPWEKLRKDLLMYLQILTVLFLIFSLCAPILHSTKKKEQIMMVFDTSASMQTLYSIDGTTRLEQAKKEAIKQINAMKTPFELTIISCSNQPQVLLNSSMDRKKIFSVLDHIEQKDCNGNLNSSISLCESIYSQWNTGTCMFFTDSSLYTGSIPAQIYDLSTSETMEKEEPLLCSNLFISYLNTTINKEKNYLTIDAQVGNYGSTFPSSDVNFYLNDTLVDVQRYANKNITGGTITITSKKIPIPEDVSYPMIIKTELQEQDALAADNISYDIVEETSEEDSFANTRILLATKQNSFLERILSTYSDIYYNYNSKSVTIYKINSIEDYNPTNDYDLFIFDGIFPEKLPKTGSVLLLPDSKHEKASAKIFEKLLPTFTYHKIIKNQYINLMDSTVSKDLEKTAFPVSKMLSMETPKGAETIFSLDDGSSCGYIEQRNQRFFTIFGFDLHDSTFPLKTEFPIIMYQILEKCSIYPGFFPEGNKNITPGTPITIAPFDTQKKISIRNQEGKEVKSLIPSSSFHTTTTLEKCGIYDFYTKSEDYHAYLHLCFPVYEESNILAKPQFSSEIEKGTSIAKTDTSLTIPMQKLLILLSLFLLIVEFIVWIRRQWNRFRHSFFFALRFLLVLLLCLSLLDVQITLGKSTETTLFLVDVSDSMKRDLSSVQTLLKQAAHDLPSGSKAGIIAFGTDTRVEQFINDKLPFTRLETTPITTSTNLENALRTASYMFSNEDSKRIVLLTDGQENAGKAEAIESTLIENGISLKVLTFPKEHKEVLISNLRIPKKLSVGDKFEVEVTVLSNVDTTGLISLYSGDTLQGTKQVSFTTGTNRFLFQDTLTKDGINSYRAIIEADQDTETLNNEYVTFTQAKEKEKLLLIEGGKGESAEFEKILKAGNFSYEKILPSSAPQKLLSLKKYAVVILQNVHADDLPASFQKLLEGYVTEGGGLIAIGGDNSFALGNYQNSSLDNILPVKSLLPAKEEVPEAAMALVIDHSGSMSDGNKSITRLQLAKEAAISALSSLRKTDSIGVLAFDDSYDWVVPLTKISDSTEKISSAILDIEQEGGTSIYPAIDEAVKQLSSYDAKQKHIILLTDGEDSFKDYNDLYKTIKKEKITLSTVAVSEGADTKLLESMAKAGGGRYYYTDISTDIPRIFAQEVFLSSDTYLVNKKFKASAILSSPYNIHEYTQITKAFTKFLYGYIRTSINTDGLALIESDSHDPILAIRQLGLGTTAAFTCDVTNEWTRDYAGLATYSQFWKDLINFCILKVNFNSNNENLSVNIENNVAHITYSDWYYYDHIIEREITAICTDEDGNSIEVPLSQSKSPETAYNYEADIPLESTSVYSLIVQDKGTYGTSFMEVKGTEIPTKTTSFSESSSCIFANTYSMEYQLYDDNSTLDHLISSVNAERISSAKDFYTGKLINHTKKHTLTPYLLLFTLLLFMLDIYMRRFGIPNFLKNISYKKRRKGNQWIKKEKEKETKEERKEETKEKRKLSKNKSSKKQKKKKITSELLDTSMLLSSKKQKNQK